MAADASDSDDFVPITGNGMVNENGIFPGALESTLLQVGDKQYLDMAIAQYLYENGMHETLASFELETYVVVGVGVFGRRCGGCTCADSQQLVSLACLIAESDQKAGIGRSSA